MIITADQLRGVACSYHIYLFEELYPEGLEITIDNLLEAYRQGLGVDFMLSSFATDHYRFFPEDRNGYIFKFYGSIEEDVQWRKENWDYAEPYIRQTFERSLPSALINWDRSLQRRRLRNDDDTDYDDW